MQFFVDNSLFHKLPPNKRLYSKGLSAQDNNKIWCRCDPLTHLMVCLTPSGGLTPANINKRFTHVGLA